MNKDDVKKEEVKFDVLFGVSSSGSKDYYQVKYKYSEKDKCFIPYFDKPINLYEKIQASKASVDINTIVNRATLGDVTVLNVGKPTYTDISNIPDNLNDLNHMNLESLNSFAKLDPSIKAVFDNDVNKFISAMQDGSYADKIVNALNAKKDNQANDKKEGD